MRHAILPAAILSAALALSGCGEKTVEANNEKPSAVASKVAEANAAGAVKFNPGRWETTVKMVKLDADGMPPEAKQMMEKMMGQGHTVSSCMTKEEAEKPNGKFFGQADENCTYDHFSMGGGTLDAKLTCKAPQGTNVISMKGSYTPDTYTASMQMQAQGPNGKAMNMTMDMAAKRTGECTGKEDSEKMRPS
jgi:hypothetical protein